VDDTELQWPFFDDKHRALAASFETWLKETPVFDDEAAPDRSVRMWVRALGDAGWLRACTELDVRALSLARERLAYRSALGDFAFAMQGLGSGAITLFGSPAMRGRYLNDVASGKAIAAFALSERERYIISGEKAWISNAGIADFYVVFARTADAGAKGLSAFIVDADTQGFDVSGRIDTISPHPLGTLSFKDCEVSANHRLGEEGDGFRIAMGTLDVFRTTVGAAALGFARRAYDETQAHAKSRQLFGAPLAALQLTQAAIADMALEIDAAALLVYRAAWRKDTGAERVTREAAMAKLYATEAAGRIADRAVQLFGGRGVTRGEVVERIYRDVRALRIYEGASEIQKLVIARTSLGSSAPT
jgi:acyl-CoA dehydrogenase